MSTENCNDRKESKNEKKKYKWKMIPELLWISILLVLLKYIVHVYFLKHICFDFISASSAPIEWCFSVAGGILYHKERSTIYIRHYSLNVPVKQYNL